MKTILSKLNKSYTGTSLAHIAVEVGEEEDIRLLVQSGTVDWTETGDNEDPAILWALKNDKLAIFDLLAPVSKINLQGDPSADLTIFCGSETLLKVTLIVIVGCKRKNTETDLSSNFSSLNRGGVNRSWCKWRTSWTISL